MENDSIKRFLSAADRLRPSNGRATFVYFAIQSANQWFLLQGRILLDPPAEDSPTTFQSMNIRVGRFLLSESYDALTHFLADLERGHVQTPEGEFIFPRFDGGYRWEYEEFHPAGQQSRLEVLTISGRERETLVDRRSLDWEVRSANPPYDSIDELLGKYHMNFQHGFVTMELVAPAVIVVDLGLRVDGNEATIGVVLSRAYQADEAFLGYKVLSNREVVSRGQLVGKELAWSDDGQVLRGSCKIEVPNAAIVHCFAGYQGRAESFGWIVDPNNHQNPRRSAYEVFDKELKKLTEVLFRQPGKGARSDDFETAISWLLWIRGFSIALIGTSSIPELKEGPDLLVTTPSGNVIVVECTMGMLKEDNKLPKVVARANQVREQLEKSGNAHLAVLPAMVTSLPRTSVEAELPRAAELGVYITTREGIDEALRTSFLLPDADRMFHEAQMLVAEAKGAVLGA
ncbi:hypothetical protein ACXHMN_10905 [Rhizobium sp. LEGMi12c]